MIKVLPEPAQDKINFLPVMFWSVTILYWMLSKHIVWYGKINSFIFNKLILNTKNNEKILKNVRVNYYNDRN